MPQEENPAVPTGGETPTAQGKQEETKTETMIPKSRFDEINQRNKEMASQLAELQKAQEEADALKQEQEKAEAEKRGEFERLYKEKTQEAESLLTFKERAEKLEATFGSMVDSKLSTIPEEFHELIPSNLTAEAKLEWIAKAESKGLFKGATEQPIGQPTNPKGESKRDVTKMSPMEKLLMGYGKRK